ncbi:MAG: zinc finger Ran-binding domain-containing protein [Clostridiales bacterium]|nr:zinc finger Ran-binding domain-containing protein [Clostridiales bacterium]
MRCPKCNQWNRASLPKCIRCGTPLATDTPIVPSWRAQLKDGHANEYIRVDEDGDISVSPDEREVLAAEMTELKARKEAGEELQRRLRADAEARAQSTASISMPEAPAPEEPLFGLEEESITRQEEIPAEAPEEEASTAPGDTPFRRSRNPRGTRVVLSPAQWEDSRAYDPVVDAMQQQNVFQQPPNLKELGPLPSRRVSHRRVIRMITLALVVGVVLLAGYFAFTIYEEQRAADAEKNRALVTASILNDQAAHTILIPGEDGQQIYISNDEIRASYTVVGGFATIEIADHVWYENLPDITEESMSVTLLPYVKTASGRQKPIDPITYDITIPLSPITLVTPESLHTEVTTAMYSMQFQVRPKSKVTINGVDMSDTVNENGEMTYNATVQPIGDNVYNVHVRSPYCRDNTMTVTLFREVQEIPLDLSATTYTSTSNKVVLINCTTIPGADIEVLSPHTDLKITELDTTGVFSFNAVFDHIGYNTISINASYPGKKTSKVDYTMYYVPSPDIYTRSAWPLNADRDYNELLNNIEVRAAKTQVYLGVGTIAYFISETKPQMAVMYCSDDGQSRPVLLENQTKTTWKVGQYYKIYCDAHSTYNGMPWLIARYTY